jgi:hypothetical protein
MACIVAFIFIHFSQLCKQFFANNLVAIIQLVINKKGVHQSRHLQAANLIAAIF